MPEGVRVAWAFDWFAYYAAGVLDALSESADILVLTREHGLELGRDGDASAIKRAMLPESAHVEIVRGAQSNPLTLFDALRARTVLKAFQPDIIHIQDHFDWRLWLATGVRGIPKVLTIHDVEPHPGWVDPRNRLQRWIERAVRRTADVILVHGESLVELTKQQPWYSGQIVMSVPLGTQGHLGAVMPLPERPTVLFFGRLEYYKGLDLFVAAVETAAKRLPQLHAIVAGQGESAGEAQALVTRPELFEWRIGFVPDEVLPDLFAESSVVVLPYREASQSGVIPIAFTNGRAVIATRVGGLVHAVEDGANGVLVAPGDPDALADAMVAVLSRRSDLKRLSTGALDTVRSGALAPEAIASAHILAYSLAMNTGEAK